MLYFSWQDAAEFTLPSSNYLIYSIFHILRLKCRLRLPGWQVLEMPELMWSSTPAFCWLQFRAAGHWQAVPRGMCDHTTKAIAVTEQFWSSSFKVRTKIFSTMGDAEFLQQESGLCWGLWSPWLMGLLSWQLHPCLLSALEECFKKTWNQNILLGDCFLSFSKQAG